MKKPVYEWVVISSKGDDLYLTENQYQYFTDHREDTFVDLDEILIRPAFIVKAFKRIAQVINIKYKCKKCYGNGFIDGDTTEECPVCKGTGVDLG